jgi:predicted aminopeptidase
MIPIRPLVVALLAALVLGGCVGYYGQAVRGHMKIMGDRVPLDEVIEDPGTAEETRARLELVREARAFASAELGLPDNGSYSSYVELDRPYVVWNVFAAGEFSVEPRRWCFPVAGCVVYRGYFAEEDAERYAARLTEDGWDTSVGGVAAYSTLGRFDDPVLSSMLGWRDYQLAGLIFHELAHQVLYVKGDSEFNESFATAVEEEGLARWLEARGEPGELEAYRASRARAGGFSLLIADARQRLGQLYARDLDEAEMRAAKAAAFEDLRTRYRALRESWDGYPGYDAWFEQPLNNARLVPVATYRHYVPAFRAMLREVEGDLPAFYAAARELGELEPEERRARLDDLLQTAPGEAGTLAVGR